MLQFRLADTTHVRSINLSGETSGDAHYITYEPSHLPDFPAVARQTLPCYEQYPSQTDWKFTAQTAVCGARLLQPVPNCSRTLNLEKPPVRAPTGLRAHGRTRASIS